MQDLKLTATSYIVLGLLDGCPEELTPYDLKQRMAFSVDHFWTTPHAQVYREPERLAAAGYATERREDTGRRRRFFTITDRGREALEAWRREAPDEAPELRDAGVLKLFFGADPAVVAAHQLPLHERQLAEYRQMRAELDGVIPAGQLLALDAGILHEEAAIAMWRAVASPSPSGDGPTSAPRA